jgi:hypothetical protein
MGKEGLNSGSSPLPSRTRHPYPAYVAALVTIE